MQSASATTSGADVVNDDELQLPTRASIGLIYLLFEIYTMSGKNFPNIFDCNLKRISIFKNNF